MSPAFIYDAARAARQTPAPVTAPDPDPAQTVLWSGIIGIEGEVTGDRTLADFNSLKWVTPLPLKNEEMQEIGVINNIERRLSDGALLATGTFTTAQGGLTAAASVNEEKVNGVLLNLDNVQYELRSHYGEEVSAIVSADVYSAIMVETPAYPWARISVAPGNEALLASASTAVAAPVDTSLLPPLSWFTDPHLSEPTALQVAEDGRVMAHLAAWGTPHIGITNEYVTPPKSPRQGPDAYRYFNLGGAPTSEGWVAAGSITLGTLHAADNMSASAARYHYENTGAAVADVVAGEDAHGIWIAGAVRPGISPDKLRELRSSPLSGDWRRIAGKLELVAALSVNIPGFPIPRPAGVMRSGKVYSLRSAGVLSPAPLTAQESQVLAKAWRIRLNRVRGGA